MAFRQLLRGNMSGMGAATADELLRLGREALGVADWERARALLEQAAELGETAEVLDGLGEALQFGGEHDAFGSPEEGEALVARNPNLRLLRVPGAGHNSWIDEADTVVVEIERFLATEQRSGVDAA